MKLKALALTATLAVSGSAQAGWDAGSTTPNGELLFMAWDSAAQKSVVIDTGIRYQEIADAWNADPAQRTEISTALDLSIFGGDTSNITWSVAVSSYNIASGPTGIETILSTKTNGVAVQIEDLNGQFAEFKNFDIANIVDLSDDSVNNKYEANSSGELYWPSNFGTQLNSKAPFVMSGGSDDVMNLFRMGLTLDVSSGVPTLADASHIIGDVRIMGDTLYINKTAVPVPAAAWLMISGLAGFGAIARRKKKA